MYRYAYYNGEFGRYENLKIPITDRSVYFGDGVYDAAIGRYEFIMWEEEHIERFLSSARKIGIEHSYTPSYISSLLKEIAVKSCIPEYFLYFQISRNAERRNHSALGCTTNLLVTIEPIEINPGAKALKLITYPDLRYGYCDIKTVNLLPAVLASTEAERHHCDEAVFIKNSVVTECSKSNISIIKNGVLKTHPLDNQVLPGIVRRHLLLTCQKIGLEILEEAFTIEEMMEADELLVTSTTKLVRRAESVDGIKVGMKNSVLAEKICQNLYFEYKNLGDV